MAAFNYFISFYWLFYCFINSPNFWLVILLAIYQTLLKRGWIYPESVQLKWSEVKYPSQLWFNRKVVSETIHFFKHSCVELILTFMLADPYDSSWGWHLLVKPLQKMFMLLWYHVYQYNAFFFKISFLLASAIMCINQFMACSCHSQKYDMKLSLE